MRTPEQIRADRWAWIMNWCKERGLAPALSENWDRAAMAWIEHEEVI